MSKNVLEQGTSQPTELVGPDFMSGGGEMGALMRAHDWSSSSLGPPSNWSQSLRTVVRLMLNTGHPMYIFWGADSACLYNDAYRRSIGPERHPGSLGRPGREVWHEVWDIIGPQIEQVRSGGGATWHEDHLVPITRYGRREDVYWTYSYSPIDDDTAPSGIGGVLVICTETTQKVIEEQRLSGALTAGQLVHWETDLIAGTRTWTQRGNGAIRALRSLMAAGASVATRMNSSWRCIPTIVIWRMDFTNWRISRIGFRLNIEFVDRMERSAGYREAAKSLRAARKAKLNA